MSDEKQSDPQAPDVVVTEADDAMAHRWFGHANSHLAALFAEHRLSTQSAVRAEIIDQLEKGLAVDGVELVSTRTLDKLQERIQKLEAALTRAESDFHLIALDSTISYQLQSDAKRARDNCRAALTEDNIKNTGAP